MVHPLRDAMSDLERGFMVNIGWSRSGRQDLLQQHTSNRAKQTTLASSPLVKRSIGHARAGINRLT